VCGGTDSSKAAPGQHSLQRCCCVCGARHGRPYSCSRAQQTQRQEQHGAIKGVLMVIKPAAVQYCKLCILPQRTSPPPHKTTPCSSATVVRAAAQKHIVITGGNTGIGYEAGLDLAGKGFAVTLACRDDQKAAAAAARIRWVTGLGFGDGCGGWGGG